MIYVMYCNVCIMYIYVYLCAYLCISILPLPIWKSLALCFPMAHDRSLVDGESLSFRKAMKGPWPTDDGYKPKNSHQ